MGLKLYTVYIHNGEEFLDEDWEIELVVAEDEETAEDKGSLLAMEKFPYNKSRYFYVTEVPAVGGHPIIVGECEDE